MESLVPWMTLRSVHGIGNLLFGKLIDFFETPERVLDASISELVKVNGISQRLAENIKSVKKRDASYREIETAQKKGIRIITLNDPDYPPLLKEISDPPPFFYVLGKLQPHSANIAVVGSRNATDYGLSSAWEIAGNLAAMGITIVSGMARGVDTAAHEGAIEAGGATLAILGTGLLKIYPSENAGLYKRISENGAVISEFHLNAEPAAHHFPIRNRVISGLSLGVVVVEAAKRSGALITARTALDQNREVFALPGSVRSARSAGTHSLIKQGAKLAVNAQDIIEEFPFLSKFQSMGNSKQNTKKPKTEARPGDADEQRAFDILSPYPVHIDDLAFKLSMEPGNLSALLLQLELKGLAKQAPGKMFYKHED